MTNENLDTTNKLITPGEISPNDDAVIKQLSDNLQDITPEDVDAICDEMDESEKKEEEKNNRGLEAEMIESKNDEGENGGFEIICEADGSNVEYNESKGIVKWKGKEYDMNTFQGIHMFLSDLNPSSLNPEIFKKIIFTIGI